MGELGRKFILTGHRGAKALAPENTLPGFFKALECGATGIEFDVRATADGVPVIVHDDELERVAGVNLRVSEANYKELSKVRVHGRARIPTLREVLAMAKGRLYVDIEVKVPGVEEEVVEALHELEMVDEAIITSFLPAPLEKIKKLDPRVYVGILLEDWDEEYLEIARKLEAVAILPAHDILTHEIAERIKAEGYSIITWTVNSLEEAEKLFRMGVDGIITDDPCALRPVTRRERL
ncbi:glycerophosphodiester phosphodiesterase [Infirmifilum lucidum]|uniref:Glycerophosphodiester phosphodiesterase n=1 Tax=Infirmifilum lucidum TaxID=2776706 RepID=A0A7L9FH82_9CREN|nr:glycerophosphodiester phosphodiesterase [Infirmifilum lucidum]QOJ79160.1 glycerophosphodiester phosphodiesterase [Infirmifilum lucidum]